MTMARQILFIQGGGAGTHDEWDNRLVESLQRVLGDGYEIRYPRMPDEDDPSPATWSAAIRRELTALEDGAVVVGHSVGAAILIHALAEQPPGCALAAIVLIAAPFVGAGGWPSDEFEMPKNLGTTASTRCAGFTCSTVSGTRLSRRRTRTCMPRRSRRRWCTAARSRSPTEQRSERRGTGDQ